MATVCKSEDEVRRDRRRRWAARPFQL